MNKSISNRITDGFKRDAAGFLLKGAIVILAEYHILWCLLHSFVWKFPYQKYEQRYTLCLLALVAVRLIIKATKQPDPRQFLRRQVRQFRSREQCILVLLFVWFALDCAIHQSAFGGSYFKDNDWRMFQFFLAAALFFPFARTVGPALVRRIIEGMIHFTTAVHASFCAFVLWNYLHANYLTFPSGKKLEMLSSPDVAMRMGVNQNITAAQVTVMIGLCLYMIITQEKRIKAVYLIPSCIYFIVLVLSNSRASFLGTLCMMIMSAGIYTFKMLRDSDVGMNFRRDYAGRKGKGRYLAKRKGEHGKIMRAAAAMAVIVCLALMIQWLRVSVFSSLQSGVGSNAASSESAGGAVRMIGSGLSGRDRIWRAAITMLMSGPRYFFLGVMPSMVGKTLVELKLYYLVQPHCHNLLLQIAASIGVPAMIVYCIFLCSIVMRAVRIILNHDRMYEHAWAVTVVLLGILVIDLVESFLFGPSYVNMPIFYLFAGWLVALDQSYTKSSGKTKR